MGCRCWAPQVARWWAAAWGARRLPWLTRDVEPWRRALVAAYTARAPTGVVAIAYPALVGVLTGPEQALGCATGRRGARGATHTRLGLPAGCRADERAVASVLVQPPDPHRPPSPDRFLAAGAGAYVAELAAAALGWPTATPVGGQLARVASRIGLAPAGAVVQVAEAWTLLGATSAAHPTAPWWLPPRYAATSALLALGATWCRPRALRCPGCPVAAHCGAYPGAGRLCSAPTIQDA